MAAPQGRASSFVEALGAVDVGHGDFEPVQGGLGN
jgi:hypothetical protein